MPNLKSEDSDQTLILRPVREIVGGRNVLTSIEDLTVYAYDASAPAEDQLPLAVILPGSCEEVSALLQLANQARVPVVPRGSGTGLAGAAMPLPGSLVLLTSRLNRILEVDSANLTALVEPGVITGNLASAVAEQGLFYPPDPGSMSISTLGGNVALNSGGLRGLKYGVTRDYVMGLEVVLAGGEVLHTGGKCKKDAAGYHLTSLFVGSEGTLGVITQIMLRLLPQPESQRTAVAYFSDVESAAQVVAQIIAARIIPVTLELLDDVSLQCVEDYAKLGLPKDAGAMLLIEVDGAEMLVDKEILQIAELCELNRANQVVVAPNLEEADKLKAARRSTLAALARRRPTVILEDITVPRSRIPDMVQRIREIADLYQIEMAIFGHAGDGNLHPTGMTDSRNREEVVRVEAAFTEIFKAALELGGTITGEHGVGIKKRHMLPYKAGATGINTMAAIKRALDPNNILNPGKVLQV
jgi:glycolate oxidase